MDGPLRDRPGGTLAVAACAMALLALAGPAVAADRLPVRDPGVARGGKLSLRLQLLSRPPLVDASPADQARALGLPRSGGGSLMRSGTRLLVYVRVTSTSAAARAAVTASGLRVTHVSSAYRTVTGLVEPRGLRALTSVPAVRTVTEALRPATIAVPPQIVVTP